MFNWGHVMKDDIYIYIVTIYSSRWDARQMKMKIGSKCRAQIHRLMAVQFTGSLFKATKFMTFLNDFKA